MFKIQIFFWRKYNIIVVLILTKSHNWFLSSLFQSYPVFLVWFYLAEPSLTVWWFCTFCATSARSWDCVWIQACSPSEAFKRGFLISGTTCAWCRTCWSACSLLLCVTRVYLQGTRWESAVVVVLGVLTYAHIFAGALSFYTYVYLGLNRKSLLLENNCCASAGIDDSRFQERQCWWKENILFY